MANLSNASPWAAGLEGFNQAITGSIKNVGAIQDIVSKRDLMAKEAVEAPLRLKLLNQQVTASGLQLEQEQMKQKFLRSPWDINNDPLILNMEEPDKKKILKALENVPQEWRGTMYGRQFLRQMSKEDAELNEAFAKSGQTIAGNQLTGAYKNYMDLLNKPGINPQALASAKQNYDNLALQAQDINKRIEDGRAKIKFKELEQTPEIQKLMIEVPEIKMLMGLGDPKGLVTILEEVVKSKYKTEDMTAEKAFFKGKIKALKEGEIPDYVQWAKEWKEVAREKEITIGTTRPVQKGDQLITEEYTATGWKEIGRGPKFNPNALGGMPQQTQFVDPVSQQPMIFDRTTGTYKIAPVQGGVVAPRPVNLSAGEREKTAGLEVINNQLERIEKAYKPQYVGLVSGPAGAVTQLSNPKEAEFRQIILDVKDSLLRARSGAQINEQEYARLAKLVPDFNDSEAQFKGKMTAFKTTINNLISERQQAQRKGGVYLRGGQSIQKTVVERRKSKSGKTLVKYSDGTIGEE